MKHTLTIANLLALAAAIACGALLHVAWAYAKGPERPQGVEPANWIPLNDGVGLVIRSIQEGYLPVLIGEPSDAQLNQLPPDVAEQMRKEIQESRKTVEQMQKNVTGSASGSLLVRRGDRWYKVVLDLPGWRLHHVGG